MFRIFVLLLTFYFTFSLPPNVTKGIKPESCPLNEEPTDCVEYCLPTCEKPKVPPCEFYRCSGGCVCKEGYIREKEKGKCVPISSCVNPEDIVRNYTEPCKENEVMSECAGCQKYCSKVLLPSCCLLYCPKGCVCKEGFIRKTEGGICIPEKECF